MGAEVIANGRRTRLTGWECRWEVECRECLVRSGLCLKQRERKADLRIRQRPSKSHADGC